MSQQSAPMTTRPLAVLEDEMEERGIKRNFDTVRVNFLAKLKVAGGGANRRSAW